MLNKDIGVVYFQDGSSDITFEDLKSLSKNVYHIDFNNPENSDSMDIFENLNKNEIISLFEFLTANNVNIKTLSAMLSIIYLYQDIKSTFKDYKFKGDDFTYLKYLIDNNTTFLNLFNELVLNYYKFKSAYYEINEFIKIAEGYENLTNNIEIKEKMEEIEKYISYMGNESNYNGTLEADIHEKKTNSIRIILNALNDKYKYIFNNSNHTIKNIFKEKALIYITLPSSLNNTEYNIQQIKYYMLNILRFNKIKNTANYFFFLNNMFKSCHNEIINILNNKSLLKINLYINEEDFEEYNDEILNKSKGLTFSIYGIGHKLFANTNIKLFYHIDKYNLNTIAILNKYKYSEIHNLKDEVYSNAINNIDNAIIYKNNELNYMVKDII